jgi:hypothetical protein
MENRKSIYPSDLTPIPKIFDRDVQDIFFSPSKKQFFTKNKHYKRPSIKDLKPIVWNEIHRTYTTKDNNVKTYNYRYVLIPHEGSYLRLKEDEWNEFFTPQSID